MFRLEEDQLIPKSLSKSSSKYTDDTVKDITKSPASQHFLGHHGSTNTPTLQKLDTIKDTKPLCLLSYETELLLCWLWIHSSSFSFCHQLNRKRMFSFEVTTQFFSVQFCHFIYSPDSLVPHCVSFGQISPYVVMPDSMWVTHQAFQLYGVREQDSSESLHPDLCLHCNRTGMICPPVLVKGGAATVRNNNQVVTTTLVLCLLACGAEISWGISHSC